MSGLTAEPDLQQKTDCAFQADVHMERGKNGYRCVKSSDVGFNCRTRPTTKYGLRISSRRSYGKGKKWLSLREGERCRVQLQNPTYNKIGNNVGVNCGTRPTTKVVTMSGSTAVPDLRLLSQQIQ